MGLDGMLDLRALQQEPPGVSSLSPEGGTRFIWLRVCEHCLCRTVVYHNGRPHCMGCSRAVFTSTLEDDHP